MIPTVRRLVVHDSSLYGRNFFGEIKEENPLLAEGLHFRSVKTRRISVKESRGKPQKGAL